MTLQFRIAPLLMTLLFMLLTAASPAQERVLPQTFSSPHATQSIEHPPLGLQRHSHELPRRTDRELTHTVFGYHPYWIHDSIAQHYRLELLSHMAYFSAEVDPVTGELLTNRGWLTAPVVDRALAAGVKVQLAVTNFGAENSRTLLQSPAARDTLIRRLIELVRLRGANGLAIDFEAVPGDQRDNLTSFFADLSGRLHAELPNAEISAAIPAVDWSNSWDAAALAQYIDIVFVMCYDYSWSGSTVAGPVSPIGGMTYNVDRSLTTWLQNGIPKEHLIMGVPYYGYDWPVTSDTPQSSTTGRASARTYSYVHGMLQRYSRQWSEVFLNPWFPYQVIDWRQVWYDDAESLEHKYRLVLDLDIGGIGIWALGYDADFPELWDLIADTFTRTTGLGEPACARADGFALYPQPARSAASVTVLLPDAPRTAYDIALTDLLGRTIWKTRAEGVMRTLRLQLPEMHPGMYFLKLSGSSGSWMQRMLIAD
jgi:spore germination protein YaaH